MKSDVKEKFPQDVKNHSLDLIHDDGLHRHMKFSNGGSSVYYFNLTTWPGYLAISGDMGCYVFSRIEDMFRFFRQDKGDLRINPGYWEEKCRAMDRHGQTDEFSSYMFIEAVKSEYDQFMESLEPEDRLMDYSDLWGDLESNVLRYVYDGYHFALQAAMEYKYGDFNMRDFYDHRLHDYTYQFEWCLYAIVWGIEQYDLQKGT